MPRSHRFNTRQVREDMLAKGWLAQDLAERAGLTASTVSRFLAGQNNSARTAKKVATALGRSVRRYIAPNAQEVA